MYICGYLFKFPSNTGPFSFYLNILTSLRGRNGTTYGISKSLTMILLSLRKTSLWSKMKTCHYAALKVRNVVAIYSDNSRIITKKVCTMNTVLAASFVVWFFVTLLTSVHSMCFNNYYNNYTNRKRNCPANTQCYNYDVIIWLVLGWLVNNQKLTLVQRHYLIRIQRYIISPVDTNVICV